MITGARPEVGPMAAFVSILLTMSIGLSNAACASTRPNRSRLPQLTPANRIAGVSPGSWEMTQGLRSGSPLIVTLKTGDRLEGAFKALTLEALILTDAAGKEISVPRSEVETIVARVNDDLANGALIGAGIGFGAALGVLTIAGSRDGSVLPSAKWGAPLLLSGIGSLVGILVDRAQKRQELVFRAPEKPQVRGHR
jgi:hypothetical protein